MCRRLTCLLVSGVVSLAACGEQRNVFSPIGPGIFTVEDAQFVASVIDNTSTGLLDDFFDLSGGDPTSAPALSHLPIEWGIIYPSAQAPLTWRPWAGCSR